MAAFASTANTTPLADIAIIVARVTSETLNTPSLIEKLVEVIMPNLERSKSFSCVLFLLLDLYCLSLLRLLSLFASFLIISNQDCLLTLKMLIRLVYIFDNRLSYVGYLRMQLSHDWISWQNMQSE